MSIKSIKLEAFVPFYGNMAINKAFKESPIKDITRMSSTADEVEYVNVRPVLNVRTQLYVAAVSSAWFALEIAKSIDSVTVPVNTIAEGIWQFTGLNDFDSSSLTEELVNTVCTDLGIWTNDGTSITFTNECIEYTREKMTLSAREVGTEERQWRDVPQIGKWNDKAKSYSKSGDDKKNGSIVEAIDYLESQQFTVNYEILSLVSSATNKKSDNGLNKMRTTIGGVLRSCWDDANSGKVMISQNDYDNRGRIYYMDYNSPHPAANDLQVALYKQVTDREMVKGSAGHQAYLDELADIAGAARWLTVEMQQRVLNNKLAYVKDVLLVQQELISLTEQDEQSDEDIERVNYLTGKYPKNPLKYLAMLIDLDMLETTGAVYPSQPVGLDAKSSGTQIFAILSGNKELGDICGLTTASRTDAERKAIDPYAVSANIMNTLVEEAIAFDSTLILI